MIEMKYQEHRCKPIVLNEGVYKGHKFAVLNLGTHPTAYVECKLEGVEDYDDNRICDIEVNGGLTFYDNAYWEEEAEKDDTKFIGWDYAHCWDWAGYWGDKKNIMFGNKKHTTAEMTDECFNAIDQLIEIEKENEE